MPNLKAQIIENLTFLKNYTKKKGEKFKPIAYGRAIMGIRSLPGPITSPQQVKGVRGVGKRIYAKVEELFQTGKISAVEEAKKEERGTRTKKEKAIDSMTQVWGVGPSLAERLYTQGIRSISDMQKHKKQLPRNVRIGLKYRRDIATPISRDFAQAFEVLVEHVLTEEFGWGSFDMEFAGSYRRGLRTLNDIDCLLSSTTFTLQNAVDALIRWGVVFETLSCKTKKFMGIAGCPSGYGHPFRFDIEFVKPNEWWTALLYFTGSQANNVAMRETAKRQGYLLNQSGLFRVTGKTKRRIPIHSERDVFRELGLPYLSPEDR